MELIIIYTHTIYLYAHQRNKYSECWLTHSNMKQMAFVNLYNSPGLSWWLESQGCLDPLVYCVTNPVCQGSDRCLALQCQTGIVVCCGKYLKYAEPANKLQNKNIWINFSINDNVTINNDPIRAHLMIWCRECTHVEYFASVCFSINA